MRSDTTQTDILRDSPASRAAAYRIAADTALHDPYWQPEERAKRAAYYAAEADRIERQP